MQSVMGKKLREIFPGLDSLERTGRGQEEGRGMLFYRLFLGIKKKTDFVILIDT